MKCTISFRQLSRALAMLVLFACAACSQGGEELSGSDPTSGDPEPLRGKDADIDQWMYDYLKTHYLWNEAVRQTTPDYSLGYEDFLDDVLTKVAAQNDVNHDDGHWENGKRSYFYSNVQRYKSAKTGLATRGTHQTAQGLGIEMMYYAELSTTTYAFIIAAVTPGSPADKAGLERGDLIVRVDGAEIRNANLNASWSKLMSTESGTVRLTPYDIDTQTEEPVISVTAAAYDDTPIWKSKLIETASGKKVGYLVYGSFNYYYDDALIGVFQEFRQQQVDEVVLDLRYNGGGHVVSSTVLGTLVAGEAYKGSVYAQTAYNASRQGETPDIYKLGEAQYNTGDARYRYDAIATALRAAVDRPRLYVLCTSSTASASELVVNGLRGLDFDVRLIGETTNGKNVGMEPIEETFDSYEYEFSPITFYISNAKGERDYGDGFEPDVEAEDLPFYFDENSAYCKVDWGDEENDLLLACALFWIEKGVKPTVTTASTRALGGMPLRKLPVARPEGMLRLPVVEE